MLVDTDVTVSVLGVGVVLFVPLGVTVGVSDEVCVSDGVTDGIEFKLISSKKG